MQEEPRYLSKQAELTGLFRKAKPRKQSPSGSPRAGLWLIVALIGTTVPLLYVSLFFCHMAILCLVYIFTQRPVNTSKSITAVALILSSLSILSGCSPLLSETNSEISALCEDRIGMSCGMGVSQGWSVMGWTINYATTDQAKLDGGVSDVFGLERMTGHGLVSVTRIVVYGG